MKKRLFTLLLALVLIFSALPGVASAAGIREAAEIEITVPDASAARRGRVFQTDLFSRLDRLGGLTQTETYTISEALRNAVCDVIYAGLKNWDETIDVSEFDLPVEDGYACFRSVLDAHLELFYVQSTSFSYGDGIMFELHPFYDTTYTKSSVTTFNNLCASVIAGMPNGTDPEKLLYLHDWLVTHCEYDLTYNNVTAYNAMVDGRAVCDGYAKAYKHLCDLAGLDCEYVSSEVNNHAWNMVMLNVGGLGPAYYYIDCTWDDPTNGSGLTAEMECNHTFFLQCKEECMEKHKGSDWLNGAGENIYNNPTTEYFRYGNGWWKSLNRPVQWVGTKICYAKKSENGKVYFRNSGSATETAMAIPGGGTPWYVFGGGGSSWIDAYITPASLGSAFYFTTPTQIYKLTTDGTMSLVYTLTSAQQAKGYLYGIQAGSAGLTYYIGEDPRYPSVATGTLTFPPAVDSVTANKTSAKVGDAITWTAAASGGSGTLKYCFYIYKDGTKVASNSYGSAKTYTYTPTEPGTYTAKAFVKDSAGVTATKMSTGVTVSSTSAPLTITGITANKTSAAVGESITWTASASGGSGTLKYCFYIYKGSAVVEKGSYTTGKTYSYTPTEAGTYKAKVFVKDTAGTSVSKISANVSVTAPLTITGITANKTSAAVGESITWTAAASGGSGTLKYCFYIYKGSAVVEKGSYTTGKTYSYTPTEAGTYKAKVFVKDTAGTALNKMSGNVTVTAAVTPVTVSGITANKTSAAVGESITWTAAATGGSGTLKYCFYIYNGSTVVKKGTYGTAKTYTYTPTAAGTYKAKVFVKDTSGTTASKVSGSVAVTEPLEIIEFAPSTTWALVTETIYWYVDATGGSGTLRYCFYIYDSSTPTGTPVIKSGYTTENFFSLMPTEEATFTAKVFVKDEAGTIVSQACYTTVSIGGA